MAHSQGRVTPHPQPRLPQTVLRLTSLELGGCGGREADQQGKGFIHHAKNRSEEGQVPQSSHLSHISACSRHLSRSTRGLALPTRKNV